MVLVVDENYGDPDQESDQDDPGSGDQLPGLDLNMRMRMRMRRNFKFMLFTLIFALLMLDLDCDCDQDQECLFLIVDTSRALCLSIADICFVSEKGKISQLADDQSWVCGLHSSLSANRPDEEE